MNNRRGGIGWFLGIAVILLGILLAVNYLSQDKKAAGDFDDGVPVEKAGSDDFNLNYQPYIGDPDADIQIVEFADYKCPACKHWKDEVLPELKREYLDTGKAVYYYIDMPFLAPDSTLAALAGETLYQQDQDLFWTYFDLMMKHQGDKRDEWANRDFIVRLVQENIQGADLERFIKELDDRKYAANIEKDIEIAENHAVDGTPTVFVNGVMAEDASFAGIQDAIGNR
ncbi:DsbA family protein [Paenibacillus sp. DYY-L-2]|uniref:DsbA family protein n=1 Tax=Paenibacillus sp. DYY-L-2 TaxID=3447013 RepID=UPI003F4FAB74